MQTKLQRLVKNIKEISGGNGMEERIKKMEVAMEQLKEMGDGID
ncbi:unnamed protein product, partial [marine sediment metagenome]